jgi:hypothetical protein
MGPSRGLEALATHRDWTAASTLRGRRDAGKLTGGHRPSIGSAKQVNTNDTTDVSNTKLKLLFFIGASLENGEEEDCTL